MSIFRSLLYQFLRHRVAFIDLDPRRIIQNILDTIVNTCTCIYYMYNAPTHSRHLTTSGLVHRNEKLFYKRKLQAVGWKRLAQVVMVNLDLHRTLDYGIADDLGGVRECNIEVVAMVARANNPNNLKTLVGDRAQIESGF